MSRQSWTSKKIIDFFIQALLAGLYDSPSGISTLANRSEVQHSETRAAIFDAKNEIISEIKNSNLTVASDEVDKNELREKSFHARVDEAKTLLLEGKAISAKSILLRVREEVADLSPSPELKFRIATNLGACALDLNDLEAVETEFKEALNNKPDDTKALGNTAVATFLKGDINQAIYLSQEARDIDAKNSVATSIYIQALSKLGLEEKVSQLLEDETWIEEDETCTIALGEVKFEAGIYEEAEKFARKSLSLNEHDPRALELLSRSIVLPIKTLLQTEQPLRWSLPSEIMKRLNEALDTITAAINSFKKFENPSRLHLALINRSAILSYLGRYEDALKDCDRILQDDDANEIALVNKGIMLIRLDQFPKAISCLKRIEGKEQEYIKPFLAQAYVRNNQALEAVSLLAPIWSAADDAKKLEIAELLLDAHSQLENTDAIETITNELEEKWSDNSIALLILAHQKQEEDKFEAAINLYKDLLARTRGLRNDVIQIELANLYYSLGNYQDAAQQYGEVVDETAPLLIIQRFATSLFKAKRFSEALSFARKIRGSQGATPVITEIEVIILGNELGDLPEAKKLSIQLSEIEPENYWHQIRIADICCRTGDRDEARAVLRGVSLEAISKDPHALIEVARLRSLMKMDDVLSLAYQARQLAFNDPEIHLAYVSFFLAREQEDEELFKKEEVDNDCVVHLKRGEDTETFIISADQETDLANNILNVNYPLVERLKGHKGGDQIVWKRGLEDLAFEIADIQSKYVFAFQETFTKFSTLFPDIEGFEQISDDKNLSKMRSFIDKRHEHVTETQKLYFEHKIPLCTLSQVLGVTIIEAWQMMIGSFGGRLISAGGSTVDREEDIKNISHATCVVMDVTALLTVRYLGLEEPLAKRFDKIYVTQSIVDEVNNSLRKLDDIKPKMTVGKIDDKYIRHEVTEEALEREKTFLEGIPAFVRSSMEVKPTTAALKISKEKMAEFEENLGKSSIDAILVSEDKKALFYSDDLGLRALANNEWSIKGTNSLVVLLDLIEKKIISSDQYYDAITRLAVANYEFISINADGLLNILKQNGMVVSRTVAKVIQTLEGPACDEKSAVIVCSELLKKLWLDPTVLEHHRQWVLDSILQVMVTGRIGSNILDKLKDAVRVKLRLVPWAQKDILQSMEIWRRQHIV